MGGQTPIQYQELTEAQHMKLDLKYTSKINQYTIFYHLTIFTTCVPKTFNQTTKQILHI